jgi:hypothetical protein
MTDFDVFSPETQRTIINLMLAALARMHNRGKGFLAIEDFDVSPETQRTIINLMLAALARMHNRGGAELGEVAHFEVNPGLQREFLNSVQAYVAAVARIVISELPPNTPNGPPPSSDPCKGLLQALQQEIKALGGVPVGTVQGWRERFASCRGKISESEYNQGMSLLSKPTP